MMKRNILLSVFAVLLAFALPLLLSPPEMQRVPETAETPSPLDESNGVPILDSSISLRILTDTGVREMSMSEYLPGALAGEMPAAFDSEALKAQAIALRTYALHYQKDRKQTHPEADICASSACCAVWISDAEQREKWGSNYDFYASKLSAACLETDGQYLVYEDKPILAVFHASSSIQTESGADLGTDRPYLQSVSTPETTETVQNLCSTVEVSAEEFRQSLSSLTALEGTPDTWLGKTTLNDAGRVQYVSIGGKEIGGLALRQMFSLRSTDFTLLYDGEKFVFRCSGYGHGMGMSQHGANLMAKQGSDYAEILAHYYPGSRLVVAMLTE